MSEQIGVGTRVWEFDTNYRVYRKDEKGYSVGSPIFECFFRERWIVREEGRSWWIGFEPDGRGLAKVGKANLGKRYYTDAQKADAIWLQEHRYRIQRLVQDCRDATTLRRVADAVGYKPAEPAA